MEQMRISSYCGGFTLYEVMISITAVGIISGLITVSLLPLLDRSEFVNTAYQFKDTLRQAKWLALTKRKSHRINSDSGLLILQKKSAGSYLTVSQEKIPDSVITKSWPSFSVFGFASSGSIVLGNEDYSTKVVVSPIGRISQTTVERK